jgi:hypothetical protein
MRLGSLRHLLTFLVLTTGTWCALAASLDAATAAAPTPLLTHAQAANQLAAAGVTWVSSGDCADRTKPACTSFSGIRQSTVDGVRTLKAASGCPVVVTGGTEAGHAAGVYSHWNGWKIDIRRNACLDAYVARWFKRLGIVEGWGEQWLARSGNLYTNEGRHWDVVFYTCGCRR